ncbi:DgyrCDS14724 [Dimorphilus gyrociliatus]|uniref:DgyrCDS14724 n=1 Tax=Dimorphilus gyrociliatus TaxID=2664684 RepID=A0A7I8WEN0_9ANNE|nr:DgyrCDS14724 [Dimorphilus gyrociliatus]
MAWGKEVRNLVFKKYEELRKIRATARALGMAPSTINDILRYQPPQQENRVIFMDKARFSLSGPDDFRTWTKDVEKNFRVTKNMGRGGVMVWGLITSDGVFEVWRISQKLTAQNYSCFVVEDVLPVIEEISLKMGRNYIFQQDNAGCHTARATRRAFRMNGINPIDWPAKSPDLSPIENMWHLTKNLVYDGAQFQSGDELWEKIKKCSYQVISQNPDLLPNLYAGMGGISIGNPVKEEKVCKSETCHMVSNIFLSSFGENTNNICCKIFEKSLIWQKEGILYGLTTASKPLYQHVLAKQENATFDNRGLENCRIYYQSCLDHSQTIEKLGAEPLLGLIRSLGGWGADNKSSVSKENFQDTIEKLTVHNISPLFSLRATKDKKNSSRILYHLEEGDLELKRDQLINGTQPLNISSNKALTSFKKYIMNINELLGGEKSSSQKLAIDIITFHQKIASFSSNKKEKKNDIKMFTFKELQEEFPFMDWLQFANNQYKFHNISKVISEDVSVAIPSNSQYFYKLNTFLNQTQQTKEGNRTLHNFLIWQVIQDSISSLSKPFRQAKEEFDGKISGKRSNNERWLNCLIDIKKDIGSELVETFVEAAFFRESEREINIAADEIISSFEHRIQKVDWLSSKIKNKIHENILIITDKIKHPYFVQKEHITYQIYENWNPKISEYFQNRWNLKGTIYEVSKNEIHIPEGVLQEPFYYPKNFPKSVSYGAIGHVLGHELSHGFSDSAEVKNFDKNGELKKEIDNNIQDLANNLTVEEFNLPGLEDKTPKELFTMSYRYSSCLANKPTFCS